LTAGLVLTSATVPVIFVLLVAFLAVAMSDFTYSLLKNYCPFSEEHFQALSNPSSGKV
jgi:hypothetical protein